MHLAPELYGKYILVDVKICLSHPYQNNSGRFKGVYVNEDLTKFRSGILFDSRKLAKERRIYSAWSSNGTILLKDNSNTVHKISKAADLVPFQTAVPRPPEPAAAGPS